MLAATLVKHAHHRSTFDELFDRHFPAKVARTAGAGGAASRRARGERADPAGGGVRPSSDALQQALEPDSDIDMQGLVEDIVDRYAGIDDRARTERYHLYRVLRAIDLAAILSAAIRRGARAMATRRPGRTRRPAWRRCGR